MKPTHGGKRLGSGRPKLAKADRAEALTIRAHPSAVARFKAFCDENGFSHREGFEFITTADALDSAADANDNAEAANKQERITRDLIGEVTFKDGVRRKIYLKTTLIVLDPNNSIEAIDSGFRGYETDDGSPVYITLSKTGEASLKLFLRDGRTMTKRMKLPNLPAR